MLRRGAVVGVVEVSLAVAVGWVRVVVSWVRVVVLAEALWEVVACWGVVEVLELESSASLSESSQAMSSSSGAEAASGFAWMG